MTLDKINEYFEYKDGELFWKKIKSNRVKVGGRAGYMRKGYLNVGFETKEYPLHHIVFFMFKGYFPKLIDHIDGNRINNKIENLREATLNENARNCKRPSHNTSGYKGVCWSKKDKKWQANITLNNKLLFLGLFKEKENAYQAYCHAAKNLFGEFARLA
jgi:hypothetical protein